MARMNALIAAAVASIALVGSANAQMGAGQDPFIGTWKLNVERSVYTPGPRPPSDLVTFYQFQALEDGATRFVLLTGPGAAGNLTMQVSVFRIDGQPHPVHTVATVTELITSGTPTNMARSYRQIDANTVEFTAYTDGVAGAVTVRQIGANRNEYTQRPADGQTGNVLLFERVR